jgi:hypothetical protein
MTITKQQREQAEEQASEVQLHLYAEPEAGEQLWNIATKFDLTERSVYYSFTHLVGDIVLGFYKESDLAALIANKLPQIQGVQKIGLEADIKVFLYPLTDPSAILPRTSAARTPVPSAEIAETELALEKMQGLRTMAQDLKEAEAHQSPAVETVYQSSQTDILRPGSGDDGKTPQWETDN